MDRLRGLARRITHLVRRRSFDEQISDEMEFHLMMEAERNRRLGDDAVTARRNARLRFGGVDRHMEAMRSGRGFDPVDNLIRDVGYACRTLRRTPAFTVGIVIALVLGIGVNVFVFTVANGFLLQPLPVRAPEELVRITTTDATPAPDGRPRYGASSYADYVDLARAPVLDGALAYAPTTLPVTWGGGRLVADGQFVSGNYFDVLGISPARGRFIRPGEESPVAVLGYSLWQREFGGRSDIVGMPLSIGRNTFTVIGVAPRGFTGTELRMASDIFVPFEERLRLYSHDATLTHRGMRIVHVMGRLRDGVPAAGAEAALGSMMSELAREYPQTNAGRTVRVTPAGSLISNPAERAIGSRVAAGVLIVTLLVLAIACLNVASLMLTRAVARRREIAIRLTLGASRRRVAGQLLLESEVLAVVAGGIALLLMAWLSFVLTGTRVGSRSSLGLDMRVLGFTVLLSTFAGLVFGAAPALRMTRQNLSRALQEGHTSLAQGRLRSALVVVQLALSTVLLVAGVSLGRSVKAQYAVEPGFEPQRLLVLQPTMSLPGYSPEQAAAYERELAVRIRALPGVESVAVGMNVPLSTDGYRVTSQVSGVAGDAGSTLEIAANHVGPDYFRTLRVPLLRGEEVTASQSGRSGVVVTAELARQLWPNRDPIGEVVRVGGSEGRAYPVIGVASDIRFRSLAESPAAMMFVQDAEQPGGSLHIRTATDPGAVAAAVQQEAERLSSLVLFELRTMDGVVRASLAAQSAVALSLSVFAGLAVLLACVGLYGLLVFGIVQSRGPLGVRMALGATTGTLRKLILVRSVRLVATGLAAGLVLAGTAAFAGIRLAPRLFVLDLVVFPAAAALLAAVALVASLTSTRALAAIDPMAVMRDAERDGSAGATRCAAPAPGRPAQPGWPESSTRRWPWRRARAPPRPASTDLRGARRRAAL